VAYRKPDQRCVDDWIEKHSLQPHELLVVGDQFVDAQLALNIGAQAVLVARDGEIPHLEKLVYPENIAHRANVHVVTSLAQIALV